MSLEDPRVRVDIGHLMQLLAENRPINKGYIFGSRPPTNDSFWKKYGDAGNCEVHTYNRSPITHYEKQVDTSLCCKIVSFACGFKYDTSTVMVVLTGDLDVLPALEEVLETPYLKMELWSWLGSLSSKLKSFIAQQERIKVRHLDEYIENFIFTSWKFDVTKSAMDSKARKFGVVVTFSDDISHMPYWKAEVDRLSKWPFQYYFFPDNKRRVLILFMDGMHLGNALNVPVFLQEIMLQKGVVCAETYTEFKAVTVEDWDDDTGATPSLSF